MAGAIYMRHVDVPASPHGGAAAKPKDVEEAGAEKQAADASVVEEKKVAA